MTNLVTVTGEESKEPAMPKKSEVEEMPPAEELKIRKVCEQCGLIHESPLSEDEAKADDWKIIALSVVGVGLIVLIWIFVFKWGVPLVKHLSAG